MALATTAAILLSPHPSLAAAISNGSTGVWSDTHTWVGSVVPTSIDTVTIVSGSTVTVDIRLKNGEITEFAHDVKACALGQASSSIMARNIIGATPSQLRQVQAQVRAMLKNNAAPPSGKWSDIAVLEPVRDFKARHASTLLTFDAVVDAVTQAEARHAPAQSVKNL